MKTEEKIRIAVSREMTVSKANFLVQHGRFKLTIPEQKTLAYIISLIPPKKNEDDIQPLEYKVNIREYCKICGFSYDSGKNYDDIKATLQKLSDRSMWLPIGDDEVLCRWLSKARTNKRSGIATIKLDEDLLPFLFDLQKNFTAYQLLDILPMTSKYSIRLYDLLKSYANLKFWTFDADELQEILESEYKGNYYDFEKRVLKIAEKEINIHTALNVRHEVVGRGKFNKVTKIKFYIYTKTDDMKKVVNERNHEILDYSENWNIDGQMNLEDYTEELHKGRKGAKK